MDLQQAYCDGFAAKCAECGVDPAQLAAFGQWMKSQAANVMNRPATPTPAAPPVNNTDLMPSRQPTLTRGLGHNPPTLPPGKQNTLQASMPVTGNVAEVVPPP